MSDGTGIRPAQLYTPRMLALSVDLAQFPLDREFELNSEARSRTCGSAIELGVDLGEDRTIARLGMAVSACAVGQSSAAIMAKNAIGATPKQVREASSAISAWLAREGPPPDWPEFDALAPALDRAGRHGALLLPWTALTQALSTRERSG